MDYYCNLEQKSVKKEKEMNTKLIVYIGELPVDVDRSELDTFITEQGNFRVESLYVKSGENKSFAYVKFKTALEASRAIKALHLKMFKNCMIKAEPFKKNNQTDKEKNNSNLFIKNLPKDTTPKELFDDFNKFGNIISINLRRNSNGDFIGQAYINYDNEKSAHEAIKQMNNTTFKGSNISVSIFTPKKKRIEDNSEYIQPMLLIKKMPENIKTESHLQQYFQDFGDIIFIGLIEEITGKLGVIVYSKKEEAEKAVNGMKNERGFEMSIEPAEMEIINKIKRVQKEKMKAKYEGCNLIIKNLPKEIDDSDLLALFSKYGKVKSARTQTEGVLKEIKNNLGDVIDKEFVYESTGTAYVLFSNNAEALNAKESLNEIETCFKGKAMKLSVEFFDYNKKEKTKIAEIKKNMGNQNKRVINYNQNNKKIYPPQFQKKIYNTFPENNQNEIMPPYQMSPQINQFMVNLYQNNINKVQQSKKITVEGEHLVENVKEILKIKNEEERTEALGEKLFYFLKDFIPQYNLNITEGKYTDNDLCSKLTGILIKTDENNLIEIISNNERLYTSLNDVIEKMINSNR